MIGTASRSNPDLTLGSGQRKSTVRRVTFSAAEPQAQTAGTRSRQLPSSPRSSSPGFSLSAASSPRARDVPLSQHLTVVSYAVGPGRNSGMARSSIGSRENGARTLSAERHNSARIKRRTQSAGQQFSTASSSFQELRQSSSVQTPSQQYAKTPPPGQPQLPNGGDLYISSTNAPRQQQQEYVAERSRRPHSSASFILRKSSAVSPSRPEPEPQRRLLIPRPQTTTVARLKDRNRRRLGADMYPSLQRGDLDRERAWFRSEVCLIGDIMQAASRPQSMKWRAAGVTGQQQQRASLSQGEESFCKAFVAEPFMNDADRAKVFHLVPQRVVSARGGAGIPGASSALQRLNQSTCHRHALLHRAVSNDPNFTTATNYNGRQYRPQAGSTRSSSRNNDTAVVATSPFNNNDKSDNDKSRSSSIDADTDDRIDAGDNSGPNNKDTQIATRGADDNNNNNTDENNVVDNIYENAAPNDADDTTNASTTPRHSRNSRRAITSGDGSQSAASTRHPDRSSSSRGATTPALDFSRDFLMSGLKGVDVMREHSAVWLEETRLKNQESVAILSEQLKSMLPESDDQGGEEEQKEAKKGLLLPSASSAFVPYQRRDKEPQLIPAAGEDRAASPRLQDESPRKTLGLSLDLSRLREDSDDPRAVMVARDMTPRSSRVRKDSDGMSLQEVDEGDEQSPGRSELCMKTMQCEVLGPYSCADCTKIRFHERHNQEQTSLYPGIAADPRTLVAPDRIRKLTASLPPSLVSQRHTLDCGCSVKMHPDFLYPVIVTDNDVHSRLRTSKSAAPKAGGETGSGEVGGDATLAKRRRSGATTGLEAAMAGGGKVRGEGIGDAGEYIGDGPMPSPVDMKVTVRYNTPSPDHKGVFLTNGQQESTPGLPKDS